ncbi:hypothetical protein [Rubrivirga marina]|uniref:hypothetical protein n=1 Tax=Rubrivirga marina TaxID=1196024 RepID=UPI000BA993D7|nr:hypothetical protein [Rubrivirga marina]
MSASAPPPAAPGGRTFRQKLSSVLALFTSTGTLFCCALPSAIAALAGGAAVASFVSTFPWLVPLSQHKGWIFLGSGLMIALSGVLIYRPRGAVACTIAGGEGCAVAGRFTKVTFWLSAAIFSVGTFFAYGLVPALRFLDA